MPAWDSGGQRRGAPTHRGGCQSCAAMISFLQQPQLGLVEGMSRVWFRGCVSSASLIWRAGKDMCEHHVQVPNSGWGVLLRSLGRTLRATNQQNNFCGATPGRFQRRPAKTGAMGWCVGALIQIGGISKGFPPAPRPLFSETRRLATASNCTQDTLCFCRRRFACPAFVSHHGLGHQSVPAVELLLFAQTIPV